ncbi:MAG: hypothetical protein KatS3mg101_0910 [Patescibacteria group bacterium]|nr:MAG: hypothetical protein KatS3mg101_0910 [Patescibacteria group bacterium]
MFLTFFDQVLSLEKKFKRLFKKGFNLRRVVVVSKMYRINS